jgi:hypothetical protein
MSIEQQIADLTAAINRLAEAYGNQPAASTGKRTSKPKADHKPPQPAQVPAEPPADEPIDANDYSPADGQPEEQVTLETLGGAVMELAKLDRDSAIGILAEFGVQKAGQIAAEKWGEAVGKFRAKLAERKGQ